MAQYVWNVMTDSFSVLYDLDGFALASVTHQAGSVYTATVYLLDGTRQLGNTYKTAASARAACIKYLTRMGTI